MKHVLAGSQYSGYQKENPSLFSDVNYSFVTNKDGRFAWRPYELMHPAIYVSLACLLCEEKNWNFLKSRFAQFNEVPGVECCSLPVMSMHSNSTDQASQVKSWWQKVEQKSLALSLEYTHVLHTDVTDCYGSLYTHSIAWALHGVDEAKASKGNNKLLGNQIDRHIQAGRWGQTNGICQGSVLMDFIAEIVLGYIDEQVSDALGAANDFRILRYRDDYRVFTKSDQRAEEILKTISDQLRSVGMKLGTNKTRMDTNVIEGAVKSDKLAGIDLQDLGDTNAQTVQKQLLRLHSFGRKYPNSGALRRLLGELHEKILSQSDSLEGSEIRVQVAIATDIARVSPLTFPAIAGILSKLISILPETSEKVALWQSVHQSLKRLPYNGHLEIWLQRVTKPLNLPFESGERICQIVDGKQATLWGNDWISSPELLSALDVSKILVGNPTKSEEVITPSEVELFKKQAENY